MNKYLNFIFNSFKKLDWKTFFMFYLLSILPAIWELVRVYIITGYMNDTIEPFIQWTYLEVALEIFQEGLIFPLFWWFNSVKKEKNEYLATKKFINKVGWSYLITTILYLIIIFIASFFVFNFVKLLGSNSAMEQKTFFLFQLWSKIPVVLFLISSTVLIILKKWKAVIILVFIKLILGIVFDFTLSNKEIMNEKGYIDLGLSNFLIALIIFITSFLIILKIIGFRKFFTNFEKIFISKEIILNVCFSFLDSLIRNVCYLVMVALMLNAVKSSDSYWMANSIIWNWILLPISKTKEFQKAEVSSHIDSKTQQLNLFSQFLIINTAFFIIFSIIFFPIWKPFVYFMTNDSKIMENSFLIFKLIIGFYYFHVLVETMNASISGQGKSYYLFIQSFLVHLIFYMPLFLFYQFGNLVFDLRAIIIMFGFTFVVGCVFTGFLFFYNMNNYRSTSEKKWLQF